MTLQAVEALVDLDVVGSQDDHISWHWSFRCVLEDGTRIGGDHPDHHYSGWRTGISAIYRSYDGPLESPEEIDGTYHVSTKDVTDCVRECFDGHPEMRSAMSAEQRDAWKDDELANLIEALSAAGHEVGAEALRALPLQVVISEPLRRELAP